MATYGKKKRSLMSSFASLRDLRESDSGPKPKKEKLKLKVSKSVITMPSLQENSTQPLIHEDSIEEMASMLLDDTTMNQLNTHTEPGRRLSHAAAAGIFNNNSLAKAGESLLQLPKLAFSGDDAWDMQTGPIVAAAGNSNQGSFDTDGDPLGLPLQSTSKHFRNNSAPTIPRKSSKRRSSRSRLPLHISQKRSTVHTRENLKASISPPKLIVDTNQSKASTGQNDINEKVRAMLAATQALKGDVDNAHHVPPPKKRRFADYNVLSKMKTVISDRFPGRNGRKKDLNQEERTDERLLDDVDHQYFGLDVSPQGAVLPRTTIRLNEGNNFVEKPKVLEVTGHGKVKRKPVADDGRSLRERKSDDDPFSEPPHSDGPTRVPTNFETRLRDDMSIDESRENSQDLPAHSFTPRNYPVNPRRASTYADFDAILSSSPIAQSTPRIRLEPSFGESEKKILRNVPGDSRSVFDFEVDHGSDMDLDDTPVQKTSTRSTGTSETPIRKKSQSQRYSGLNLRGHGSNRRKKHPSPSKAELESLEHALRDYEFGKRSSGTLPNLALKDLGTSGILTSRDANVQFRDKRRSEIRNGDLKMVSLNFLKSTESMPNISSLSSQHHKSYSGTGSHRSSTYTELSQHQKSYSGAGSHRSSTHTKLAEDHSTSMMDIDELQWDQTAYHIGMRPA